MIRALWKSLEILHVLNVRVNEFTSAHVQLPGLLVMSCAERSAFALEGSQLETRIRTCAELSAPSLMCSVSDGVGVGVGGGVDGAPARLTLEHDDAWTVSIQTADARRQLNNSFCQIIW